MENYEIHLSNNNKEKLGEDYIFLNCFQLAVLF